MHCFELAVICFDDYSRRLHFYYKFDSYDDMIIAMKLIKTKYRVVNFDIDFITFDAYKASYNEKFNSEEY